MCACRIDSNPATPHHSPQTRNHRYTLDEYCSYVAAEMETKNGEMGSEDIEDVYSQLAQKEQDLVLAAELGKALLEQNEELQKKNDQLSEEYTQKIEGLVQEKHELRLKLETIESEYEVTVRELQNDVTALRQELSEQQTQAREGDKSRSQIVEELTKQNERLTTQLRKATKEEDSLQVQLQTLRDQIHNGRTSMHEHAQQLEVLRGEVTMLNERKVDLERRIAMLTEERDVLSCSLEESHDRVLMLERQKREQDQTVRSHEREIGELQELNSQLEDRLHDASMSVQSSNSTLDTSVNSLFNELEMSTLSQSTDVGENNNQGTAHQFKHEVMSVYSQLRGMVTELQGGQASPTETDIELKMGSLQAVCNELKGLLDDITKHRQSESDRSSDSTDSPDCVPDHHLRPEIHRLKKELIMTQKELKRVKGELEGKDKALQRKTEELVQLTSKIKEHQEELQKMQEEKDRLQDAAAGLVSKDEIIEQARGDRDKAIEKSNKLEQDLAQSRLDIMSLDSQLMESIQQKLELSQQLEQWQIDMEELLQMQMAKRIEMEGTPNNSGSDTPPTPKKSPRKKKRFPFQS